MYCIVQFECVNVVGFCRWNLQFSIFRTQKIILVGQGNVSSSWFIFSINFTSQLLGFLKLFSYFVIFYNCDLCIFSHFFPSLGLPVTQKVLQLPVFFLHFLFLVFLDKYVFYLCLIDCYLELEWPLFLVSLLLTLNMWMIW